jgi:cephalosporin hydroxylase
MKYKKIIGDCTPAQNHQEVNDLLVELEKFEISSVLEIGVHMGGSIRLWKRVLSPAILIGIDEAIHPDFAKIKGVHKIEGLSQDKQTFSQVRKILGKTKLDFLFIDGSHKLKDVASDFYMYKKLVRRGGVVVLHDVITREYDSCEVYKFWDQLSDGGEYRLKTIDYKELPGATGCGIVYL